MNRKKQAKNIYTFDFATLYTKIPHNKLFAEQCEMVDLVFKGGNNKFICVDDFCISWTNKTNKADGSTYSKSNIKTVFKVLLDNCFLK